MKSPLLVLAACFALGVVLARPLAASPTQASAALAGVALCLLVGLIAIWKDRRWMAGGTVLIGFFLAGLAAEALFPYRFSPSNLHALDRNRQSVAADIQGVIASAPERVCDRVQFLLNTTSVELGGATRKTSGRIGIYLEPPTSQAGWAVVRRLHEGREFAAPVRLYRPTVYRNPGEFNYRAWLDSIQDIDWEGRIDDARQIRILNRTSSSPVGSLLGGVRARLLGAIDAVYPPWTPDGRDGAVLKAMLLGDRRSLDSQTIENFRASGLYHLLVIAGLHIGLLLWLFHFLFRRVLRLRETATYSLLIVFLLSYASLVEERAATMRATLMILAYLLARLAYRDRFTLASGRRNVAALNAIGLAALVLLVSRPAWLFDAGFQFSFGAVLIIALLALPILSRFADPFRDAARLRLDNIPADMHLLPKQAQFRIDLRRLVRMLTRRSEFLKGHPRVAERVVAWPVRAALWMWSWIIFCFVLQIGILLPMAAIFHRVSVIGFPLNVVVLVVMTALLASAIPTVALAAISPKLAAWPAKIVALLLKVLFWLTAWKHLPHWLSDRVPGPPLWVALGFVLALVAAALTVGRHGKQFAYSSALIGLFAVLIAWSPFNPNLSRNQFEMTALDCGRGESLLTVLPGKQILLFGAGGSPSLSPDRTCPGQWDPGENIVSPYLWSRRIRAIDSLVLPDGSDGSLEGMAAVARNFRVKEFWYPPAALDNPNAEALIRKFRQAGIRTREMAPRPSADSVNLLAFQRREPDSTEASTERAVSFRGSGRQLLILDPSFGEAQKVMPAEVWQPKIVVTPHLNDVRPFIGSIDPRALIVAEASPGEDDTEGPVVAREGNSLIFRTDRDGAVTVKEIGSKVWARCFASKKCAEILK